MSFKLTTQLATKILLWTALWAFFAMLSAPLMAQTSAGSRTSKSISFTKTETLDKETKDTYLKQSDTDIMAALNTVGFRLESTVKAVHITSIEHINNGEITLYDASTELISDFNDDGFYHRFNVAIDADTIFATSYIYAKLYLSYEGGPWNHYATSENYHIHGDSELDIFIVETELADGFPPGYYDIRIELYNADHDEWLLSYGPYDDASLSALPLEDSYHDDINFIDSFPIQTEIVVAGHAGATSWWLLSMLPLTMVMRIFSKRNKATALL